MEGFAVRCALAKDQEETSDVFLWSARCCLEAILRALLAPYPPRRFTELPVKGLLDDAAQRTIIPDDRVPDFEALWRLGRLAVRVRDPQPPDHSGQVQACSNHLVEALTWFYEKSPLRRQPPTALTEALEVLRGARRAISMEQVALERQERLMAELEAALEDRKRRLRDLDKASGLLGEHLASERAAVDEFTERLASLRASQGEAKTYPSVATTRRRRPREGDGASRWQWVLAALVGLCVGIVLSYFIQGGAVVAPQRSTEGDSALPTAPAVDASPAPPDGSPPTPEGERDGAILGDGTLSDGAPSPRCPAEMIEFEAAVVKIHQPFPRRSWPPGPENIPPVEVGTFCLDRDPVLVSAYEKCSSASRCRPRIKCLEQPRNFPANCVTWRDADAYCHWRGAELPSVAQWERTLLHGGKVRAEPARGTWEWTADPFPAAVFERGDPRKNQDGTVWGYMALQKLFVPSKGGNRMCSWHKAPSNVFRGNLTFRCAKSINSES